MDECVWSNGGMILTGENWSTGRKTLYSMGDRCMNDYGGMILTGENWSNGRKTLYSVGGRWMNEYGAMVEWYWQGKTEVLGEKHPPLPLCSKQIWNELSCSRTRSSTVKCRRLTTLTVSLPLFLAWIFSKTACVTSYLIVNTSLPHFEFQEVTSSCKVISLTARNNAAASADSVLCANGTTGNTVLVFVQ